MASPAQRRAAQADAVRRVGDRATLERKGEAWYVISQKWWASWRAHVGYDAATSLSSSLEGLKLERANDAGPGPITNEPLLTKDRKLRMGLMEHDDYALVPEKIWSIVYEAYGGGPPIERKIVQSSSGEMYVEVHECRFDVRGVSSDGGAAKDEGRDSAVYHSRLDSCADVRATIVEASGCPSSEPTRVWLKPAAEEDAAPTSLGGEEGRLLADRFWRVDAAEDDEADLEDWWLLEAAADVALANHPAVAGGEGRRWGALVERQASNGTWPRDQRLERWRSTLKVRDLVDARDSEGRWFDSVVVGVEAERVKVHYRGWSSRWDTYVDRYDGTSLAKLFTHTEDWRRLRKGDACEVRSEDSKKPLWYDATVLDVNGDRVHVSTVSAATGLAPAMPPRWLPTSSEELCRVGTHIKERPPPTSLIHRGLGSRSSSSAMHHSTGNGAAAASSSSSSSGVQPTGGPATTRTSSSSSSSMTALTSTGVAVATERLSRSSYSRTEARPARSHAKGAPPARGAVGLSNLGNTCFMNSMLQCLSNTTALTTYFTADDTYAEEINEDNPLGAGGQLARAYADFVRDVWSGSYVVVVPTVLKRAVGKHAPQFSGYQQQDSQELMQFLLDGLHEDLNRVRQKPYTETIESNGRPDATVADESWRLFNLRNRSVVVDHCYGQLKSHITCPHCSNESITFDPYLSLTLPLPTSKARRVTLTLFHRNKHPGALAARPLRIACDVPVRDTVASLKEAVKHVVRSIESSSAAAAAADTDDRGAALDLDICDVWDHRVYSTVAETYAIENIKENDELVAYVFDDGAEVSLSPPREEADPLAAQRGDGASSSSSAAAVASASASSSSRAFRAVDVVFGKRKLVAAPTMTAEGLLAPSTERFYALYGVPLRLAVVDGRTTCAEVRGEIAARVRRFAVDPATGVPSKYAVVISDASGTKFKSTLEDAPGLPFPPDVATLTVEFVEPFDEAEFDATDTHDSARPPRGEGADAANTKKLNGKKGLDISDCLRKLVEREQLGETEQWYCSKCKSSSRAYKKLDLWKTPEVLILHLNRFKYAQNAYSVRRQKIDDLVTFPLRGLDLSPFVLSQAQKADATYDLYAVSEHSGGMGGGHYTAMALNAETNEWFHFNDSLVSRADPNKIVSPQAYVLFYRKRRPPSSAKTTNGAAATLAPAS